MSGFDPASVTRFRHAGTEIDDATGVVACTYVLHTDDDELAFTERYTFGAGHVWTDAAREAARILGLLAGVSYYKAAAPPVVDLGDTPVRPGEREFLRGYMVDGLGEYAYRNDLDLTGITIEGGVDAPPAPDVAPVGGRPLIPFGGGIDSIVTVDAFQQRDGEDPALFVVSRDGDRFEAIEAPAAVTGLPVVRVGRALDDKILESRARGFRNGHVPVTGIISAIGIVAAVLHSRSALVMSNEWSASSGNTVVDGRTVNHQYSKSMAFETAFRAVLDRALPGGPDYHSFLRPWTELRIGQRFAELEQFHGTFRSCNKAFHLDPALRLDRWCGRCDKCCFIDLILSPWMSAEALRTVFDGAEPLEQPDLLPTMRTLVGLGPELKPWECVGDVGECAAAAGLAHARPDRAGNAVLQALVDELPAIPDHTPMLSPVGASNAPFGLDD